MVSPAAAGRGVGRALARRVLEVAAEDGYAAMQFNAVVETNEHAVRLWESFGFTILATVPEAFRHPDRRLVGPHIMHRFLREPNAPTGRGFDAGSNAILRGPDSLGFSQSHEASRVRFIRSKDRIFVLLAGSAVRSV
jgi:hypothetical protein